MILFHKLKHDSEFVLSSLATFKGSLCSFDKIIHTSKEQSVIRLSLVNNLIVKISAWQWQLMFFLTQCIFTMQ